jgi:hypothetical protein
LETDTQHAEPEANIAEMLAIVESLEGKLRSLWDRRTREATDYERVEAAPLHQWHSLDLLLIDDNQFLVSVRYCNHDGPSCVAEGKDWPALDKILGVFDPVVDLPSLADESLKRQVRLLFYRQLVLFREGFAKHFPEQLGPE